MPPPVRWLYHFQNDESSLPVGYAFYPYLITENPPLIDDQERIKSHYYCFKSSNVFQSLQRIADLPTYFNHSNAFQIFPRILIVSK